jgi:hypothetical protein
LGVIIGRGDQVAHSPNSFQCINENSIRGMEHPNRIIHKSLVCA